MPITPELLDELLKDYKSPDDMFGDDGLLQNSRKRWSSARFLAR